MKPLESALMMLKRISRTGWVELGVRRPENVASHCLSLAVLVMVEAERRGLDCLKAVKMALLHDIPESYTGDLTPKIKRKIPRKLLENVELSVMKQLFMNVGVKQEEDLINLYSEYLKGVSPEAKLVHRLDRVEMVLEASWLASDKDVDIRKLERHGFIPRHRRG
ncbi:MAG: HD domain-containing protein [Candidatus Caldarchaeum sp.]